MNDDFRDPTDGAIARDLNSLAPLDIDPDAALGAMRPALQRARARRRLAVTSGALGTLVIVVGAGALAVGGHSSHLNVRQHSTTLPVASSTPSSTIATSTTRSPRDTVATSTTRPTQPTGSTGSTTPTTGDHGGTSVPGGGSTTSPTVAPPPVTNTYTSIGGRITVTFARGTLTLDASKSAAGYQTEVHTQKSDDVEVRFSNGTRESRIRIRVENGQVRKEITEN